MVLYKYCPACFSLDIKYDPVSGDHKCLKCNYVGTIKQDAIDVINEMRKERRPGGASFVESNSAPKPKFDNGMSLTDKIKSKPGASRDFELV